MKDSTSRTLRTTVQTILGVLAAIPLLVGAGDLPASLPGIGVLLAVSTVITRVMANPAVDRLLPSWLRASADPDAELRRLAGRE